MRNLYAFLIDQCKRRGGYLVEIESMNENDWIRNILTPAQCIDLWSCVLWIGATDQQFEGQFIWEGSEEKLNFSNWKTGEPNNVEQREDCVILMYPSGEWVDSKCSDQNSYICKKKI